MILKLKKSDFAKNFISPISRLTDRCCLIVTSNKVSCLATTEDSNPILLANCPCECDIEDGKEHTINIPDIKRLMVGLNCIKEDDIELGITSNCLTYNKNGMKFKYHLLEDGVLAKEIVSREKIKALNYHSKFILSPESLSNIIKGTSFATKSDKVYFYMKDKQVFAELTDKEHSNVDSMCYHISSEYSGDDFARAIPIKVDVLKIFSFTKLPINVKINNDTKIMLFRVEDGDMELNYIVSPLVR